MMYDDPWYILGYSLNMVCECRLPGVPSHLKQDHDQYVKEGEDDEA